MKLCIRLNSQFLQACCKGAANFKATLPSKADDTLTTRAKERQRKASCPCLAVNGDERISVLGCNDFETVPAKASLRRVACVCQSGMGLHWDLLRQTASQAGVYHSLVITKILVRASQSCTSWAYDIAMYRACMDRMDTSCCRRLRPTSPLECWRPTENPNVSQNKMRPSTAKSFCHAWLHYCLGTTGFIC